MVILQYEAVGVSCMTDKIKTMKLYHQVDRVFNELSALGVADGESIDVLQLSQFDQYHYLGTDAVDEAVNKLGISAQMEVLEVGGGIGGPARYLSHASGCHMTALELQQDLNDIAQTLTERCRLENRVNHVCGDILDHQTTFKQYDALVSWLAFLHIPDRSRLYRRCYDALKPGAGIYVEDYFQKSRLTEIEKRTLSEDVFCDHVPSMSEYQSELEEAGFVDIELIDVSAEWTQFVVQRQNAFDAARDRNIALHGSEAVEGLSHFYNSIVGLFNAGNLGGITFSAKKPA